MMTASRKAQAKENAATAFGKRSKKRARQAGGAGLEASAADGRVEGDDPMNKKGSTVSLNGPIGLALSWDGTALFVADAGNKRIVRVDMIPPPSAAPANIQGSAQKKKKKKGELEKERQKHADALKETLRKAIEHNYRQKTAVEEGCREQVLSTRISRAQKLTRSLGTRIVAAAGMALRISGHSAGHTELEDGGHPEGGGVDGVGGTDDQAAVGAIGQDYRALMAPKNPCSLAIIRDTGDLIVADDKSHCLWRVLGAATPYMVSELARQHAWAISFEALDDLNFICSSRRFHSQLLPF
jgi:hypothetical protein